MTRCISVFLKSDPIGLIRSPGQDRCMVDWRELPVTWLLGRRKRLKGRSQNNLNSGKEP